MVKLKVVLNKKDVKKFILHNVGILELKFVFFMMFYLFLAIISFLGFIHLNYSKETFFSSLFFCSLIFFTIFIFKIGVKVVSFNKMFVRSLNIINKKRDFIFSSRSLDIVYEKSLEYCGRYFFYDLVKYEKFKKYLYIYFNNKQFIIIPLRFVKKVELREIVEILKENLKR